MAKPPSKNMSKNVKNPQRGVNVVSKGSGRKPKGTKGKKK